MLAAAFTLALVAVAQEPAPAPPPATSAAPSTPVVSAATAAIAKARGQLGDGDVEGALSTLAGVSGPLSLDDMKAKYEILGTARAYSDDAAGAEEAFKILLALAPGASLPYTLSPKATYPFENAKKAMAGVPALSLALDVPPTPAFDAPVDVAVTRAADPLKLVSTIRLCSSVKGAATAPTCESLPAPSVQAALDFMLPAVAKAGSGGVFVQISVVGLDAGGNEVWRGPSPDQPYELGVGFEHPAPWYANPWVYGGVAGAVLVAGVVTGVVLASGNTAKLQLGGVGHAADFPDAPQ
jgi:hypothetical protein